MIRIAINPALVFVVTVSSPVSLIGGRNYARADPPRNYRSPDENGSHLRTVLVARGIIAGMSASTELTTTEQTIVKCLGEGMTRRATAEQLGIHVSTLQERIRLNPTLRDQVEAAEMSAAHMVLDDIRNVPSTFDDAPRARVAIEAWRTYLELRFPARYGKTVNMNVRTLDMNKALEQARARARQAIPAVVVDEATGEQLPAELV